MNISQLVKTLEIKGFKVGNIKKTKIYLDIESDEIKAACYARISNEEIKEMSVDRQLQSIGLFIQSIGDRNNPIVYRDELSGTNLERPGYKRLLADIKNKKVNVVIVSKLNRLGRDASELNKIIFEEFYKNNVLLICLQEKMINSVDNNLDFQQEALDSERYCQETSKSTRNALKTRMQIGSYISSKPPYGYIVHENIEIKSIGRIKKRILLRANDGTAEIVEEIFNTYLGGKGYQEIANTLNLRGVLSPNGGDWKPSTIRCIIENPLYSGTLAQGRYSKEGHKYSGLDKKIGKVKKEEWIIGDSFQGIISPNLFEEVRNEKERRSCYRKKGQPNLFSGLIKCGECGKALVFKSRDKGYKCSASQNGNGCTTHFVKENELLSIVKEELKILTKKNINEIKNKIIEELKINLDISNPKESMKNIDKEVKQIENKIKKDYKLFVSGKISSTTYKVLEKDNENDLTRLVRLRENLERKLQNLSKINDYANEIIEKLMNMEIINNTVLRLLIKQITVYENGLIKIAWNFSEDEDSSTKVNI